MRREKEEVLTDHAFVVLDHYDYKYGFIHGNTIQYIDLDKSDTHGIYIQGYDWLDHFAHAIKKIIQLPINSRQKLNGVSYAKFVDMLEKNKRWCDIVEAYDYWEAEPEYKELTVAQIEEKLGYKIKIVRG